MAGSYNHCINDEGNLLGPFALAGMLETDGDVFEAVEEMYGMIWWLAANVESVRTMLPEDAVEEARRNYTTGLELAKANKNKRKQRP